MAVMIETRTLRGRPNDGSVGPSLGRQIKAGTRVQILSEIPPLFVEVKGTDGSGEAAGWVTEDAIDREATDFTVNAAGLAQVVGIHADAFGVNAHILIAYAHMRSGFKPGLLLGGIERGPFGLSKEEWSYFAVRPDLGVDLPIEALDEWRSQSLVSALRLMLVQNLLIEALERPPTWAEIVLALMCGAQATAAAIGAPNRMLLDLIAPSAAGVDVANIAARFGGFVSGLTASEAIDKIASTLQVSVDETRPLIEALSIGDGDGDAVVDDTKDGAESGSGAGTGALIEITDTDLDALARVAMSEVGHFKKYGDYQYRGALAAVIDTILNRVAHKAFPDSIQGVIDQEKQFSAINSTKTWVKLPPSNQEIFAIVRAHVEARADGARSIIEGATHFLNPFYSDASSMRAWGKFVVDHAVASFGNVEKKDIHYHGTAPGTGAPRGYVIKRLLRSSQFTGFGQASSAEDRGTVVRSPSITGRSRAATIQERIVANALDEWNFFEQGKLQENDEPQFRRVGTYWQSVGENFDGRTLIPSADPKVLLNPAWSSAFISFIVKASGGNGRFKYAPAHAVYVQDFVSGRPGGLYEALHPETYAPQPGDLIHAGREGAKRFDFDAARQAFRADKRYASHSDVVVEVRKSEGVLIAVGGNVNQSVSQKRLKINPNGTLKARRDKWGPLPWIAILRCLG